jgi:hypothetical protein
MRGRKLVTYIYIYIYISILLVGSIQQRNWHVALNTKEIEYVWVWV